MVLFTLCGQNVYLRVCCNFTQIWKKLMDFGIICVMAKTLRIWVLEWPSMLSRSSRPKCSWGVNN